jgi:hypothetical protein
MRGTDDPEVAAFAAWAAVHGVASLIIRNRSRMIPDDQRERVVRGATELLLQALIVPPPETPDPR